MRKTLFAFALLAILGCEPQPQNMPMAPPPVAPLAPPVAPLPPAPVPPPPFIPPIHSHRFMYGYWDGYYARPANWRWWASQDYKYGYDLGVYDRTYNIHRFTP